MLLPLILVSLISISFQEANKLSSVINNLSTVARLINGISVQSEFMRSSQNLNAVVGELLGIGDSVPELLKVKVKDLIKDVDGILKVLPASSNQDLEAIGDSVKFLKSIDLEKLKKAVQLDLTALTQKWKKAKKTDVEDLFPPAFSDVVGSLKHVLETPYDFETRGVMGLIRAHYDNITAYGTQIKTTFIEIPQKLAEMNDLKSIVGSKSEIGNFPYLADVVRQYMENLKSPRSLQQAFSDMKTALADLEQVIKKSQASSTDSNSLEAIEKLFVTDKLTDKKLTAGLHNGISDLKLIFHDLNGKWLKENVADGKDMKMMVIALEPLKKFYENLKPLETSWGKMREDPETGKVVGNIAQILKNGKILKPDELKLQSDNAGKCLASLQLAMASTELAAFSEFFSKLDALDENIPLLIETMEKVTASPIFNKVTKFQWKIKPTKSFMDSYEAIAEQVDVLRNNTDLQEMARFIFDYAGTLENINVIGISETIKSFQSVVNIQASASDTGLIATIDCLNKMNFDYTATEAFSLFDRGVQALKNQTDAPQMMKVFEKAIDSLISTDKKLKGMVSRRRRRSPKLLNLENSGKLAQELGNGVQVLKEMSEVFENQREVLKVAKSADSVDTVIQGIPEMAGKWTVGNKKALEKLVDEVNKLNSNVGKNRSLESIWKQFGAAQSVNGAPIEGRILGSVVFEALDNNANFFAKSVAPDFKDFPPLQLDFTGSKRIQLQQASGILAPITAFFKDFFVMDTSSSTQPSDSSPNYLLFAGAGIGALLLIAAVGVGGYYGMKAHKNKVLWDNRERYWLYMMFRSERLEHEHALPRDIKDGRFDLAKRLIKEGAYVDAYVDGLSVLHIAVNHASADLVELLILNGADTEALSYDKKTPKENWKAEPMNPGENENMMAKRKREVMNVLEKYKGKTFKKKLPKLLPYEKFVVRSLAPDKSAAFKALYESKMKFSDDAELTTHLIVDVDDNGVYHCNKDKMEMFYEVVFGPAISVSAEWAKLCVTNVKNMYKDYDCRVRKVEFNGKIYTNVDKLKEFARGRHIEMGRGCQLSYLHSKETKTPNMEEAIGILKFNVCQDEKKVNNPNVGDVDSKAKSFYRPDMKANFIVYEGESIEKFSSRLEGVELKDYTVMSLDEFTVFLLDEMDGKEKGKTNTTTKTASTVKTIE